MIRSVANRIFQPYSQGRHCEPHLLGRAPLQRVRLAARGAGELDRRPAAPAAPAAVVSRCCVRCALLPALPTRPALRPLPTRPTLRPLAVLSTACRYHWPLTTSSHEPVAAKFSTRHRRLPAHIAGRPRASWPDELPNLGRVRCGGGIAARVARFPPAEAHQW